MFFRVILFLMMAATAACTNSNDLDEAPVPLGDFALGHNIVVAPNQVKGPVSRDASEEEWVTALTGAISDRFDRYEGDHLFNFGVSVQGYVLAIPGLPVVASPKSVLIVNIDVWDDVTGIKLTEEPAQITVLETFSGNTIVGSGLTQTKAEQIVHLSKNAAKQIQNYLVRMQEEHGWFGEAKVKVAVKPTPVAAKPAVIPAPAVEPEPEPEAVPEVTAEPELDADPEAPGEPELGADPEPEVVLVPEDQENAVTPLVEEPLLATDA